MDKKLKPEIWEIDIQEIADSIHSVIIDDKINIRKAERIEEQEGLEGFIMKREIWGGFWSGFMYSYLENIVRLGIKQAIEDLYYW